MLQRHKGTKALKRILRNTAQRLFIYFIHNRSSMIRYGMIYRYDKIARIIITKLATPRATVSEQFPGSAPTDRHPIGKLQYLGFSTWYLPKTVRYSTGNSCPTYKRHSLFYSSESSGHFPYQDSSDSRSQNRDACIYTPVTK